MAKTKTKTGTPIEDEVNFMSPEEAEADDTIDTGEEEVYPDEDEDAAVAPDNS